MAIRSLRNGTFSRSLLVGNSYYIPPAYDWIASATGTGSSNTITFSSIPQDYRHLQIRAFIRLTTGPSNPIIRFNSDSGSNYARHLLMGTGSATVATGTASTTSIENILRGLSTTNIGSTAIIDIHDYASTTKNKTVRLFVGWDENGDGAVRLGSGLWMNTNAINSIAITDSTGNFTTQTKFMLFGIKAGA